MWNLGIPEYLFNYQSEESNRKRCATDALVSSPKRTSRKKPLQQRLDEHFRDGPFVIDPGDPTKVICTLCKKHHKNHSLLGKNSVLSKHLVSKRHTYSIAQNNEHEILEFVASNSSQEITDEGQILDLKDIAWRQQVLDYMLRAGIPIRKLDILQPLFCHRPIPSSEHMERYIGLALKREVESLKRDLSNKAVSIFFETIRYRRSPGRLVFVLVRYVTQHETKEALIDVVYLENPDLDSLAHALDRTIRSYDIPKNNVCGFISCRWNLVNVDVLKELYPKSVIIPCWSDVVAQAAFEIFVPLADDFISRLVDAISSLPAESLFRQLTKTTRFSDIGDNVWELYEEVERFILSPDESYESYESYESDRLKYLRKIITEEPLLKFELAIHYEYRKKLSFACCELESGSCSTIAKEYQIIKHLVQDFGADHVIPQSIYRLIDTLPPVPSSSSTYLQRVYIYTNPVLKYLETQIEEMNRRFHSIIKLAKELNPNKTLVETISLDDIPWLTEERVMKLEEEKPKFDCLVGEIPESIKNVNLWWYESSNLLPEWSQLYFELVLLSSNISCSVGGAISTFEEVDVRDDENSNSDMIIEHIKCATMIRFNHIKEYQDDVEND
eukprot:TRINITY_DN362_c0_g1_i1.p1 TRINITY_DN362_c0_g1~~TRINITY_DN362_c0_g1_i1.p1  ORF type:complete len:614 (+),score=65.92 TRINITY_DN362_c0_g1_i1:76-1917(+)